MTIYEKLSQIVKKRKNAAICLITEAKGSTPRKAGAKMIVTDDDEIYGSVGGGELEFEVIKLAKNIIYSGKPQNFKFGLKSDFKMACGGSVSIYIEKIIFPDQLIIFGAGHIGKALAEIAIKTDFEVTVIDERTGIFDNWNLENITCINENHRNAINKIVFDKKTYICSITHTHDYDKEIAELCINNNYAYLGVIASENKAKKIKNYLREKKIADDKKISALDMPMGINIKCETPQEIAISIIAKIIDKRNKMQL